MKLVFMGSPAFALPSFEACQRFVKEKGGQIIAAFTQPDRPAGRGQKLKPVAVAEAAAAAGLKIFQPKTLRRGDEGQQALRYLQEEKPDLIVVVAYGLHLPPPILEIPPLGCVNVHPSLLPKYRGAAPAQWTLANGDTQTGITTMLLDDGMDTGPILLQSAFPVDPEENAEELLPRLALAGGVLLGETLRGLAEGSIQPQPQGETKNGLARLLTKEDAWLDWQQPSVVLHNRIRGFTPWPGAQTNWQGQLFKVHRARLGAEKSDGVPGTVLGVGEDGIRVACGNGSTLLLTEVQLAGGKRQSAAEFCRGRDVQIGEQLVGKSVATPA